MIFALLFLGHQTLGQNAEAATFEGDVSTGFSANHANALGQANLEQYRLKNSRRTFKFETGVEFELFSAVELTHAGHLIDPGNYSTNNDLNPMVRYIFKLGLNNQLAIRSEIDPNSKLAATEVLPSIEQNNKISASDLNQMSEAKRNFVLSNPNLFEIQ